MAERRMFAKAIIDSDAFLDMSLSTQALYFHLSMRADDDGFVNNPKKISRMIGASEDDMKILFAKRFILGFDSGVVVIKHWRIHNLIQKDRYKPTNYIEEKNQLVIDEVKNYHLESLEDNEEEEPDSECIQDVSKLDTKCEQDGTTGKVRLVKSSKGKSIQTETIISVFEFWKEKLNHPRAKLDSNRSKVINNALKIGYTEEELHLAIIGCSKTPFNMGVNERHKIYDDIDLIFRDAKHIDAFIETASNQSGAPVLLNQENRFNGYRIIGGTA